MSGLREDARRLFCNSDDSFSQPFAQYLSKEILRHMRTPFIAITLLSLTALSGIATADAPLKSALGLDIEQARQVDEIQARYRKENAEKRGIHNREERVLRRARIANDSKQIAIKEKIVADLKAELRQIMANEEAEIRKLLTPEQNRKYDAYIETRNKMAGSSRDVRNYQ